MAASLWVGEEEEREEGEEEEEEAEEVSSCFKPMSRMRLIAFKGGREGRREGGGGSVLLIL